MVRKLARLGLVLLVVSIMSFLLLRMLPGDPAQNMLGPGATPDQIAATRDALRLNDPLPLQYVTWLSGVMRLDLGRFFATNQPITEALLQRTPVTVQLLVVAQVLALVVAVPTAVVVAHRRGRALDRTVSTASFAVLSIPNFVLAVFLVVLFSRTLGLLPASGYVPLSEGIGANLRSIVMPVTTLAAPLAAIYLRVLRTDLISTLQQDYILAARAQGVTTWRILAHNALRPSASTLLTVVGINTGALIGGAVIMETFFALPGMGSLLVSSVIRREYLAVQALVMVLATSYVLIHFGVDLLQRALDPRVRHG